MLQKIESKYDVQRKPPTEPSPPAHAELMASIILDAKRNAWRNVETYPAHEISQIISFVRKIADLFRNAVKGVPERMPPPVASRTSTGFPEYQS